VDYLNSLPGGNAAIPYAADLVFDTSDQAQMIIREGQVSAPKLEMLPFITTGSWTGNDTALVEFATVEGSGGAIGNRGYDFVTDTSGTLSSAYTSKTVLNHDIFYPEIGLQGSVAGITEVYTSGDGPSTPGYWNGTNWIIRNLVDNSDFWKMVESPTGPGNGVTFQYNVATPYLAYGGGYMGWNGAPGSGWFDSIPGSIPVFPGNTFTINFAVIQDNSGTGAGNHGLIKLMASNTLLEYMAIRYADVTISGQRYFRVDTFFGLDGYIDIQDDSLVIGSTVNVTNTFIPIDDILLDSNITHYRFHVGIAGNGVYIYNPNTGLNVQVATIGNFPVALLQFMQIRLGYDFGAIVNTVNWWSGDYAGVMPPRAALDDFRITDGVTVSGGLFDYTYNYPLAPIYTGGTSDTDFYNLIRFSLGKGTNTQLDMGKKLILGFKTTNEAQSIYLQFEGTGPSTDISFWHDLSGPLTQYGSTVSVANSVLAGDLGLYFETFDTALGGSSSVSKLVLMKRDPAISKIFSSADVSDSLIDGLQLESFFASTDQPECTVSLFDNPETPVAPFDLPVYPQFVLAGPINQNFANGHAYLTADMTRFNFSDVTASSVPYADNGIGPSVKDKLDEAAADLRELNIVTDISNVNDPLFSEYGAGLLLSDPEHIVQRNNLLYKPNPIYLPFSTTGTWEVTGGSLPTFNKFHNVQIIDASNENIATFPFASRTFNSSWDYPFQFTIATTEHTLDNDTVAPARSVLTGGSGSYNTLVLSHFDTMTGTINKTFSDEVSADVNFWQDQHDVVGNTDYTISPGKFTGAAFTDDNNSWMSAPVGNALTDFPELHTLSEWSIDFWVYRNASSGEGLFSYTSVSGGTPLGRGIFLGIKNTGQLWLTVYQVNSGAAFIDTGVSNIPVGQWRHIELNWSAGQMRLYHHGTRVLNIAVPAVFPDATEAWIGKSLADGDERELRGGIDEFRVIDKAIHTGTGFTLPTAPYTVETASTETSPPIPGIRFTLGNSDGGGATAIPAVGKHVEFGFLKSSSVLADDVHDNGPLTTDGVFLRVTNNGTHLQIQLDGQLLEADDPDDLSTGTTTITQSLNSTWTTNLTLLRGDLFMYWDSRGLALDQRELVLCTIDGAGVLTERYRAQGTFSEYPFLDGTSFFFKTDDQNANIKLFDITDAGSPLFPALEIQPQVVPSEGTYPFSYWTMPLSDDKAKFNKFGIQAASTHFNNTGTDIEADNVNDAIIEVRNKIISGASRSIYSIKTRQTVLTGPVDVNGLPDFLESSGLTVSTKPSIVSSPLVLTFGAGFDELGNIDYVAKVTSELEWVLPNNTPNMHLYVELDISTGVLTTGYSVNPPVYDIVSTTNNGWYWYPVDHRSLGGVYTTGVGIEPVARLYVGYAVTGVSSVTTLKCFAYQGKIKINGSATPTRFQTIDHYLGAHHILPKVEVFATISTGHVINISNTGFFGDSASNTGYHVSGSQISAVTGQLEMMVGKCTIDAINGSGELFYYSPTTGDGSGTYKGSNGTLPDTDYDIFFVIERDF
jgi:hypothetical protein